MISFLLLLLPLLLPVSFSRAVTVTYRETSGKNVRTISTLITPTPSGFVVASNDTAYSMETTVGTDLTTVSYTFRSDKEKMTLAAEKVAAGIHVTGSLKGKKIDKTVSPGSSPWWQETTLPMGKWALTGAKQIRPVSVSMMNGDLMEFDITNKGDEPVTVDGTTTACVHLRMGLTGIWAMMWHGDYWFRKTDGRLMVYKGSGAPGFPPTTYEYLSETP